MIVFSLIMIVVCAAVFFVAMTNENIILGAVVGIAAVFFAGMLVIGCIIALVSDQDCLYYEYEDPVTGECVTS